MRALGALAATPAWHSGRNHNYVDAGDRQEWFVEPDKRGRWVVVEDAERYANLHLRREHLSCAEFERVDPKGAFDPDVPLRVIPDDEAHRPEDYLIHPLCSKGKSRELW